jgi:hypothetical protein
MSELDRNNYVADSITTIQLLLRRSFHRSVLYSALRRSLS